MTDTSRAELEKTAEDVARKYLSHYSFVDMDVWLIRATDLVMLGIKAGLAGAAEREAVREAFEPISPEFAETLKVLRLILPLAKGYAAAHPVGSNDRYVAEAEQVLAAYGDEADLDYFPPTQQEKPEGAGDENDSTPLR
jgi:hypothetical protein